MKILEAFNNSQKPRRVEWVLLVYTSRGAKGAGWGAIDQDREESGGE